jgi:hypothetical protein
MATRIIPDPGPKAKSSEWPGANFGRFGLSKHPRPPTFPNDGNKLAVRNAN